MVPYDIGQEGGSARVGLLPRAEGMMPGRRMIAKIALAAGATLLLLASVAYAGVCLWFVANERSLVFYPVARASISPPSMRRVPARSVSLPPASSMTTVGAARSHVLTPISTIASAAPSATSA